jgi:hypothetical protein
VHVTIIQNRTNGAYTGEGAQSETNPENWVATLRPLKGSADLVKGPAVATGIAIVDQLDSPQIVVWTDTVLFS